MEPTMSQTNDESPKIIVDSDWKEQAQREKEQADQAAQETPDQDRLAEPSFVEIIQMILLQASIGLGGYQDPQTGHQLPPNMMVAKHYIDLLALLGEKTAGNLDETEKRILEGALHELRMAFVQVSQLEGQIPPSASMPHA
ncbi:MAG: DUF1844 domain-containing protein [Phycisphaerales bacterium]|nr:DUF1844 domain-containing protein [Phycisphaerales bacterium]